MILKEWKPILPDWCEKWVLHKLYKFYKSLKENVPVETLDTRQKVLDNLPQESFVAFRDYNSEYSVYFEICEQSL